MHLTLSPRFGSPGQTETTLHIAGDVLTCDGVAYDLSTIPEGGEAIPAGDGHPFSGVIARVGGKIHAKVRVYLGDDAAHNQPADPAHWIIPNANGSVTIPVTRIEQEAVE